MQKIKLDQTVSWILAFLASSSIFAAVHFGLSKLAHSSTEQHDSHASTEQNKKAHANSHEDPHAKKEEHSSAEHPGMKDETHDKHESKEHKSAH